MINQWLFMPPLTVPERAASSIDLGWYTAALSSALSCSSASTCTSTHKQSQQRQARQYAGHAKLGVVCATDNSQQARQQMQMHTMLWKSSG
jgi:hypothetical protein